MKIWIKMGTGFVGMEAEMMIGFSIVGLGFGSRVIYQDRNYGGDLNIHLDDDVDPILHGFVTGKDCGFTPGWIAGQMLKLPA